MHTKRFVYGAIFLSLLLNLQGFASQNPPNQRQRANHSQRLQQQHGSNSLQQQIRQRATQRTTRTVKRSFAQSRPLIISPPTNRIGLLAATQIPAGGYINGEVVTGDFNGDGKKDMAALVENLSAPANVTPMVFGSSEYSISVALGNGDGTFQPATLSPLQSGPLDYLCVGDVNGDHKDELVDIRYSDVDFSNYVDVYASDANGTFTASQSYPIAANPVGVALVDADGDSKLDLVIVDYDTQVLTLAGNGDGSFQSPTFVPYSGPAAFSAVIADFNGDGKLDFAAMQDDTRQLVMYIATEGGYESPVALISDGGNSPCSMTAGDLNGDGTAELVTAGCDYIANNITIYTGFEGVSQWAGFCSAGVSIADVNGDGKNDIISYNSYASDLTVLLGNGDGTVQSPTRGFAVGTDAMYMADPGSVDPAIADFDGDGKADVVVKDGASISNFVYLQGYGDGEFRAAQNYFASLPTGSDQDQSPYTDSVASGDFNGDGKPDIVVGNCCSTTVGATVFLTSPDGSLQPGVNYGADNLDFVAVGDFNGDGKLDFAAASWPEAADHSVQVFFGNGDGTFQDPQIYPAHPTNTQSSPLGIWAADLDGDGKLDLAVTTFDDWNGGVTVLMNDGEGGFLPPVAYPTSAIYWAITVADVNGDDKPDLIGTNYDNGSIDILLGNGDGSFQTANEVAIDGGPECVTVADVDSDGKPDLVATLYDDNSIAVMLGNPDGSFQDPMLYPATFQDTEWGPEKIKVADLDGDGKLDLIWENTEFSTVGVLYGNGDGTFDGHVEFATGGYPIDLIVADVNGDGAPDVVTANNDMSGATVLLNAGGSKVQVTSDAAPAEYGQTVTLTATVSSTVRGVSSVPSGNVLFQDGGTTLGTATLSAGTATQTITTLAPGSHSITAQYSGDTAFRTSAGSITQSVTQAPTSVSLTSSGSPATTGSSVTFTATVTPGTTGTPTGTVTFMDGETSLGTGTLNAGEATFSTSALAVATHSITAAYGGDTNYAGSTSNELSQVVNDLAATTIALSSSANPVVTSQSVTFTATVTPGAAAGTVTFMDGATSLGTGTLDASGKATLTTTSLATATHSITAIYGGDTNYAGSTSEALIQIVLATAPDYTLTATPTSATVTAGSSATFTITATADQYFNGTVSFSCGTLPLGVACNFSPASLTPTNGHPAQTTLTVTTTSARAALTVPTLPGSGSNGIVVLASLCGIGVFGGLLLGDFSKRKRLMMVLAALIVLMVLGMSACGNSKTASNPNATPVGQATVQVTATATAGTTGGSTVTHPLSIIVTVQ